MRTRSHNYILPVQVVFNQVLLIDVSLILIDIYLVVLPNVFFRFPLFILLPCKIAARLFVQ